MSEHVMDRLPAVYLFGAYSFRATSLEEAPNHLWQFQRPFWAMRAFHFQSNLMPVLLLDADCVTFVLPCA